ncbi:hypothetical protein BHE74_00043534, partial [Ensete ventricosum]
LVRKACCWLAAALLRHLKETIDRKGHSPLHCPNPTPSYALQIASPLSRCPANPSISLSY